MSFIQFLTDITLRPNAYLDPGSGSFILQIIIAGALGMGLALRAYWSKITSGLRRLFSKSSSDQSNSHGDE